MVMIRLIILSIILSMSLLCPLYPTIVYAVEQKTVIDYYLEGKEAYQKDRYEDAISDFTKAIKINPKLSDAYFGRGSAYANRKQPDLAIADLTKAIEINPLNGGFYTSRGAAYAMKGLYDQALSDFELAVRLNPKDGLAYASRAVAYCQKGEYDKAWEDVGKARSNGFKVPIDFINALKKASGKKENENDKAQ